MNVVVFEDDAVDRLGDIVAMRPACDLSIGGHTLVEALAHLGTVRRVVRPHLARHLAAVRGRRIALWGGASDPESWEPAHSRHGGLVLLVNARTIPAPDVLAALRTLVEAGRRGILPAAAASTSADRDVAAALLHVSPDGGGPDAAFLADLVARGPEATRSLEGLALPEHQSALRLLALPHDVVTAHEGCFEAVLAARLLAGGHREIRPGLHVADTARVAEAVVVRRGPVVVEAGAEIGPFVCLDGPVWIGPDARVNPHAWLRGGTAVGRACRVGGEVEQSVLEPYSNKPHDGFLGHSHVGSWVNLAAGTITSNLKTSYGVIRSTGPRGPVDTGRQFLGTLVGDCVRTAIHTALPCGATIGVAATVGGSVPARVPAFQSMLAGGAGGGRTSVDQAATALGRMMSRRGLEPLAADRELLAAVAGSPWPPVGN